MTQFNKHTIIGTSSGELLFVNSDFFCNKETKYKLNSSICKFYHLCSGSITKIVVDKNFIYVKCSKSSGVLKLQIN